MQGKDPSVEITQDIVEESEDERFDEMSDSFYATILHTNSRYHSHVEKMKI